jgi:hypothetical protein
MIHPRIIELELQQAKEELARHLHKMRALREATIAHQARSALQPTGLSGAWRIVQDRLRFHWRTAVRAPLSMR